MSHEKIETNHTIDTQNTQQLQHESSDNLIKKNEINPENILITQDKLAQIKKDLDALIETFANNHSLLSDASIFWGELALWQKILTGLALTIPLIVAIVVNIGILIALSAALLVVFIAISIVLDNHYGHTMANIQQIKKGVLSLADLLGLVINSLAQLGEQFKESIEALYLENQRLSGHIDELGISVGLLTTQVSQLTLSEQQLRKTKEALEQAVNTLQGSVTKHTALLEDNQIELEQATQVHQIEKNRLSEKINELHAVQVELTLDVDKAQKMGLVLDGALKSLSQLLLEDEEKKHNFQEKLNAFLSDRQASFHLIAERISEAEIELVFVKEELKECVKHYKTLLDKQEQQIVYLEKIQSIPNSTQQVQNIDYSGVGQYGFYSTQQEPTFLEPQLEEIACSSRALMQIQ